MLNKSTQPTCLFTVINRLDSQICITVLLTGVCSLILKITALRICITQKQHFEIIQGCLMLCKKFHYILKDFFFRCICLMTLSSFLDLATDLATATCLPQKPGSKAICQNIGSVGNFQYHCLHVKEVFYSSFTSKQNH